MSPSNPADTKERLLDAAEELFADHGFEGTSVRTITTKAKVNLAAINYHFGSKDDLLRAVFARRLEPLNRERLRLLDRIEADAGDGPPPLPRLVEAFVGPALRMSSDIGADFCRRFMGRTYTAPSELIQAIFQDQFAELAMRFIAALGRALPHLPMDELLWRMHFMIGSMAHTMADHSKIEMFSGGLCDGSDVDALVQRMVRFLVAGMSAPAPGEPAPSDSEENAP